MKIKKQLVPNKYATKVISGTGNKKRWITIHDTGNTARGANAQAHANLQSRGNLRAASWHYQVDDKEAIQSLLDDAQAWHCGDGRGNGNMNSIGIEICINRDGNYRKAVENAIELTKHLMKKYNIPASRVVRHYDWSKKYCPRQLMNGKDGLSWGWFKSQLTTTTKPASTKRTTTLDGATLVKNEDAYFLATSNIKVRNAPSTRAKHTGTLPKGASINYKRVFEGNGYRWLEYTGNSGRTLFVPYRPSNDVNNQWGTFHSSRPSGGGSSPTKSTKSIDTLAKEVMDGKHGAGSARKQSLGSQYQAVQKRVNQMLNARGRTTKSIDQLAREVIDGKWGNNPERSRKLRQAGYDANAVQKRVNQLL